MGLVMTAVAAVLSGWLAERRGQSAVAYGTMTVILIGIGALVAEMRGGWPGPIQFDYTWPVLCGLAGMGTAAVAPDRAGKKCPACAERVKSDARVCRYCQHRFAEPPTA